MAASRRLLPLGVLLLLAVGAAWWLQLAGDRADDVAAVRDASARRATDAVVRLPDAAVADETSALVAGEAADVSGDAAPTAESTEDEPLPGVPVSFTGRVIDGRGVPVSGAAVLYRATQPMREILRAGADMQRPDVDFMPRTLTDAAGRFTLASRHLPGVDWDWGDAYPFLIALGEGCAPRSVRCVGCTGGEFDAGDICIEPGGWLTGRVVDERGRPLPGARVWGQDLNEEPASCAMAKADHDFADHVQECAGAIAGPDGRFRAGPFWPGTAGLKAELRGYLDQLVTARPVGVGREVDVGDIIVARGGVLRGVVLTRDGAPVPGARVTAWRPTGPAFVDELPGVIDALAWRSRRRFRPRELLTDAAGRFELGGFPAANHRVMVEAEGFEWWQADDVLPGAAEMRVELVPAARLELRLVEDASGTPVTIADITAQRCFGPERPGYAALTVPAGGEPGLFVVQPLGPGGTDLHVRAPGLNGVSLHLDGLQPGAVEQRTLRLVPEIVLAGRATDPEGTPLPRVEVVAELLPAEEGVPAPVGPPPPVDVRTGPDGRFELLGLQPGRWRVTGDADDRAASAQEVGIEAGVPAAELTLVLQPSCVLFGVLTDAAGQPLVGERIWASMPESDGRAEVRSAVGGHYEFTDLMPGRWSVRFTTEEIVLAPGERRRVDLRDDPATLLTGRVLAADGSPASNAVLYLCRRNEDSSFERHIMTVAEDGSFRNEWVEPGSYVLQAVLDEGVGQSEPVTATVVANDTTTVVLRIGGQRARVHVTDVSTGQPADGVRIALMPVLDDGEPPGAGRMRLNGVRRNFGKSTDEQGIADLGGLQPGRLRVLLTDPSFAPVSDEPVFVEVRVGEVAEVAIEVIGRASIAGSILRTDGVPARDGLYVMGFGPGEHPPLSITNAGKYHLDELLPGSWRIVVSPDYLEDPGDPRYRRLLDMTVTLAPGQELELPLTISD